MSRCWTTCCAPGSTARRIEAGSIRPLTLRAVGAQRTGERGGLWRSVFPRAAGFAAHLSGAEGASRAAAALLVQAAGGLPQGDEGNRGRFRRREHEIGAERKKCCGATGIPMNAKKEAYGDENDVVDAIIEIPYRSRNKYEVDKDTGRVRLDRVLYSAMGYPAEYGYLEQTLAPDGDPLDILVIGTEPTYPGCVVPSRVIGYLTMIDDGKEGL